MKAFLLVAAIVSVVSAESLSANLNDYVDKVMSNIKEWVVDEDLDPMPLANVTRSVSKKILLITYSLRLSLLEGALTGLSDCSRSGDAVLTWEDNKLTFNSSFVAEELVGAYTYSAKVLGIKNSGTMKLTASSGVGSLSAFADLANYNVGLNQFEVTSLGSVKTKLTGSLLNTIITMITNVGVAVFKGSIVNTINSQVAAALTSSFNDINSVIINL